MASFLRPTALKLRNFKGIAELDLTLDEPLIGPHCRRRLAGSGQDDCDAQSRSP